MGVFRFLAGTVVAMAAPTGWRSILPSIVLIAASVSGCANVTPKTAFLPEDNVGQAVVDRMFPKSTGVGGGAIGMALRGGRAVVVRAAPRADRLPVPDFREELSTAYVSPPSFSPPKAGDRSCFGVTVTPELEKANAAYLAGDAQAAINVTSSILTATVTGGTDAARLLWQASYLKVLAHILQGRADLAEEETVRNERLERRAMGRNIASRALRAEARYWAGDTKGAARDASQVVRALGNWHFPISYDLPPADQADLGLVTMAQTRADYVIGAVLMEKGQYRDALPWLELAEQTMNNVLFVKRNPLYGTFFPACEEMYRGRGLTLAAIGSAQLALNAGSPQAGQSFAHAREYFAATGYSAGNAFIHLLRARSLLVAHRPADAARDAEQGLAIAEKAGQLDSVWRLDILRGKALLASDRRQDAELALRNAQDVVNLIAGTMTSDQARVRFGSGAAEIATLLAGIDIRRNEPAALFDDLERGRARAFVAALAEHAVAAGSAQPIVDRIRHLDQAILRDRYRKDFASAGLVGDRELTLLAERKALVEDLGRHSPALAEVFQVSVADLASVQQAMAPGDGMIYFVALGSDQPLYELVIDRRDARILRLSVAEGGVRNKLGEFATAVHANDAAKQRAALADLRDMIVTPSWLGFKRLYIVPAGPAYFIPWGGLDLDRPIAVLPTGDWLKRNRVGHEARTALILGDPKFGGVIPQLEGARAEAQAVAALYQTTPLVGDAATVAAVRTRLGDGVDVLHLATHALFDPIFPLRSAVILSDGHRPQPVTAEELYAHPMSARMVVLSGCDTGLGQIADGEDLLGLSRSFFLAGARAIVSSLWPVADRPTTAFMKAFHAEARNGDIGRAWLMAVKKKRSEGLAPSFYAPFVLNGSFTL